MGKAAKRNGELCSGERATFNSRSSFVDNRIKLGNPIYSKLEVVDWYPAVPTLLSLIRLDSWAEHVCRTRSVSLCSFRSPISRVGAPRGQTFCYISPRIKAKPGGSFRPKCAFHHPISAWFVYHRNYFDTNPLAARREEWRPAKSSLDRPLSGDTRRILTHLIVC